MAVYQNPELLSLFDVYTGGPTSIGADLTRMTIQAATGHPLIVATRTDMALFPGGGATPSVESFRLSTRGFKELAAVSHLGPALATLVNMHTIDPASGLWRQDAERLLASVVTAREANSEELWRDRIAVEAYRGREKSIASMIDYACALTVRYLEAVLVDESKLTSVYLRNEYLEAEGSDLGATIPVNAVMIATFFLTGLDIALRISRWFRQQAVDWSRAMVLISGQQGRPTSGVTLTSNSVCQMIVQASDLKLPLERMYIAPHAPSFVASDPVDLEAVRALEEQYRFIWCYTWAISQLGSTMFFGYPRYSPGSTKQPVIDDTTSELSEMPRILGPDDLRTMTTRLRLVMEDPRQLLSGSVTDYAAAQLRETGNNPAAVVVPGLDGYTYPTGL
jgi:Domain of unknown function (DUF5624)